MWQFLLVGLGGQGSRSARTPRGNYDGDESNTSRTTPTIHSAPSATTSVNLTGNAVTSPVVSGVTGAAVGVSAVPPAPSRLAYTEKTMLLSSDDEFL